MALAINTGSKWKLVDDSDKTLINIDTKEKAEFISYKKLLNYIHKHDIKIDKYVFHDRL